MHFRGTLIDRTGREWLRFRHGRVIHGALVADAELIAIPHEVVDLFAEFTENVEIQTFSHVDTITAKIEAYKPKVVWEGSAKPVEIHDLQLAEGQVSFRPGFHQNWE
jgi:hypothetical protein